MTLMYANITKMTPRHYEPPGKRTQHSHQVYLWKKFEPVPIEPLNQNINLVETQGHKNMLNDAKGTGSATPGQWQLHKTNQSWVN